MIYQFFNISTRMRQHETKFEYKARFFQLSEISEKTKNIIFVIHGYGQQGKYFIQKFKALASEENCVIAPEGLSRFYLEGFSGRVGATWMTKEDRLTDIENYISYLNTVYSKVTAGTDLKNVKISIIGFSQGSATASRWASHINGKLDRLILWAGIFPPDLDYKLAKDAFKNIDVKYVYGVNDPYLSNERFEEMKAISQHLELQPETITFDGEHDIDPETLLKLFKV